MQRCKYLDDLGLEIEKYGTNFIDDNDKRKDNWEKQRETYGFDERETWNLNEIFIQWIYTRVMMYKEVSYVELNYHKIKYKDKEITQGEAIDKLLELAKEILQNDFYSLDNKVVEMIYNNSREICDLWKEIMPLMWW